MQKVKASSSDILGNSKAKKIDPRWTVQFRHLLSLRDKLLEHKQGLSEVAKQEHETFSLHLADAGSDEYDAAFALSMISSDQSVLYEIEMALNRIRTGTYGVCEVSGKEIEPERLEAIPWARFSLESQRELENAGALARTQFASARTVSDAGISESDNADGDADEEAA